MDVSSQGVKISNFFEYLQECCVWQEVFLVLICCIVFYTMTSRKFIFYSSFPENDLLSGANTEPVRNPVCGLRVLLFLLVS